VELVINNARIAARVARSFFGQPIVKAG